MLLPRASSFIRFGNGQTTPRPLHHLSRSAHGVSLRRGSAHSGSPFTTNLWVRSSPPAGRTPSCSRCVAEIRAQAHLDDRHEIWPVTWQYVCSLLFIPFGLLLKQSVILVLLIIYPLGLVHGAVLRLACPSEVHTYMVDPQFSKRVDAKNAMCSAALRRWGISARCQICPRVEDIS